MQRVSVQVVLTRSPSIAHSPAQTQVDPGSPERFCTLMDGLGDGSSLCVSTYPVAWGINVAKDEEYSECEYVRSGKALPNVSAGFADMAG